MRGFFHEPKGLTDSDVDRIIDKNPRFGSFDDEFDPDEDDVVVARDKSIDPNVYGDITPQEKKEWSDRVQAMRPSEAQIFLQNIPTDIIFEELQRRFKRMESINQKLSDILKGV